MSVDDGGVSSALDVLERALSSTSGKPVPRDLLHAALRSTAEALRSGHDRETLKTVTTRDRVVGALARFLPRALGTLVRRQLGETMCVFVTVEGRALVPLLDVLVSTMTTACKEAKASGAENTKVNVLSCLEALLGKLGVLCSSRLGDFYALSKACLKTSDDAAVRTAAVRIIVAIVRHGGSSAHAHHEDALKVCKGLLQDKHSALVRMCAGDLLAALAQHADKVHTLGLESVLQLMIKALGTGIKAHELEGRHACKVMGEVLAYLATRSAAGAAAPGLRQRAGQVYSSSSSHSQSGMAGDSSCSAMRVICCCRAATHTLLSELELSLPALLACAGCRIASQKTRHRQRSRRTRALGRSLHKQQVPSAPARSGRAGILRPDEHTRSLRHRS